MFDLELRERSQDHPLVMFGGIVLAAFIWTMMQGDEGVRDASAIRTPIRVVHEASTTPKTSRLPMHPRSDRACAGQGWGEESLECLTMIAREGGKTDFKVRLIAAAAPVHLNTPNTF